MPGKGVTGTAPLKVAFLGIACAKTVENVCRKEAITNGKEQKDERKKP